MTGELVATAAAHASNWAPLLGAAIVPTRTWDPYLHRLR
jgi:hypothetical protein